MYPPPPTQQVVTPTLERFVEDRLAELNKTREWLEDVTAIGKTLLTRRLRNPEDFKSHEIVALTMALNLNDWYQDLVVNFNVGVDGCTVSDFNDMLKDDGYELGRFNAAA